MAISVMAQTNGRSSESHQAYLDGRVATDEGKANFFATLHDDYNMFTRLDVSLTAGTDGLGLDVATPLGDYVQLRTGFAWMPRFETTVTYDVGIGDGGMISQSRYDQLSNIFQQVTGCQLADRIDMVARGAYANYKLLVDVFPFERKTWHFTAGFYAGNATIAKASSTAEAVPTMLALNIFNRMIDCAIGEDGEGGGTFIEWGDFNLALDPSLEDKLYEMAIERTKGYVDNFDELSFDEQTAVLHQYGSYAIHLGDRVDDGSAYLLTPDEHGMIGMTVKTNRFKPYLGFGYGGSLSKKSDAYQLSFDCGAMFWGGSPKIIMHDGTDLVHDVTCIQGRIGSYVSTARGFKAFPVVSLRLTRRFAL